MGPHGVEVTPPAFDYDLGLGGGVEDFALEQLIAQTRIQGLDEAILPWAARRNMGGFRPDGGNPFLRGLGAKLRAIAPTEGFW
jgi:hypothetical protein